MTRMNELYRIIQYQDAALVSYPLHTSGVDQMWGHDMYKLCLLGLSVVIWLYEK